MPKIDIELAPQAVGSKYPPPFDVPCRARRNHRLGEAAGLTQFGVNLTRLAPGAWSSQRHWHAREDEFVWIVEGEVWLVTDAGEELLQAGDCAGFKAGVRDGHHLQNRSTTDALVLTVGTRDEQDWGEYPDIDMVFRRGPSGASGEYAHKDGAPYE